MKTLSIGTLIRIAAQSIVNVLERKGIMTTEEFEEEMNLLKNEAKKEED